MKNDFAGSLFKFGELEHLLELRKTGLLYCRPAHVFAAIEDNFLRGDDLETAVELKYFESGKVYISPVGEQISEKTYTLPFKNARFISRIAEPFGNVYCMVAINLLNKPFGEIFTLNERVKEFGKYFLLITDTSTFFKRFKKALDSKQLKYKTGLVEYKDFSKFNGIKTVFQKDISFSYQQEWRLFIHHKINEAIKIEIGSIEDISLIGSSENIEHLKIFGKKEKKKKEIITSYANIKFNRKQETNI